MHGRLRMQGAVVMNLVDRYVPTLADENKELRLWLGVLLLAWQNGWDLDKNQDIIEIIEELLEA